MGQGLAERGRGRKRLARDDGLRAGMLPIGRSREDLGRAGPGEGIAGAPALPWAQVSSGGPSGNAIRSLLGRDFGSEGQSLCCRKATLRGFPWVATGEAAIPSLCGTTLCGRPWGGRTGGGAMWIVMYVAMIASLSAMGLAPSLVPLQVDKDQLPHDEA